MRIVLYCSAFNGLSQRAWIELKTWGHDVTVHLASDDRSVEQVCRAVKPDLVICPFLKDRVPADVWRRHRTIIIHPGPMGDRGPSSLDWAIAEGEQTWGVTALQAVDDMDAGPIWATRTFAMPSEPPRKGALYNGPVAELAIELIREVMAKAADPCFEPMPLDYGRADVTGRLRAVMSQSDRAFSWEAPTEAILRSIRAADGSPGVRTVLAGRPLSIFDAHAGSQGEDGRRRGAVVGVRNGAVEVATGDGTLWIGQARCRADETQSSVKLPAATVIGDGLRGVPARLTDLRGPLGGGNDITYRRSGNVGVLSFDIYNGAMSSARCRRLGSAFRMAAEQDTRVLVLRAGEVFSNGIDLNAIETSRNPAGEAWENINAIDNLCRQIITCTSQFVIASVAGNAGAGGVMLALGADRVYVREPVVLNPHYASMGLYGSEYWTYVLPRRVGGPMAEELTSACLPIGAAHAVRIGLADFVVAGDRDEFEMLVLDQAKSLAAGVECERLIENKRRRRTQDERHKPLDAYRNEELGQMSRDLFDNRSGFEEARRAFVHKRKATATPAYPAAG